MGWRLTRPFWFCVVMALAAGGVDLSFIEASAKTYEPRLAFLVVPLFWMAVCMLTGAIFSLPKLRRFLPVAVTLVGPGLVAVSRVVTFLREETKLSFAVSTACALGLAVAACAAVWFFVDASSQFDRRMLIAGAGSLALLIGVLMFPSHALAAAPPLAHGRKNVVLVFLDTLRYDDAQRMRSLAAAGARGTVFENAWAPAPWTLPSHLAILTGVDPWTVDFDSKNVRFSPRGLPLPQALHARGYATGAVFSDPLLREETGVPRGFQHLEVAASSSLCSVAPVHLLRRLYVHAKNVCPVCPPDVGSHVTDRALDFVSRAPRPYFLALNYLDAHEPYYVERRCQDATTNATLSAADLDALHGAFEERKPLPRENALRIRAQYRAAIGCLDRSLNDLFTALRQQPDAQDTVIAIVGDHGEQFGRHGLVGHGNSLYRQVLHVPLILDIPGAAPRRIGDPVSTSDLYWTLLQSAGIDAHALGLLDAGRRPPLANCDFVGVGAGRRAAFSAVDSKYHIVSSLDGREEVFDYHADPREMTPLQVDAAAIAPLRKRIAHAWSTRAQGQIELRALGYIQ